MKSLEVLLQGECIPDIQLVEVGVDDTVEDRARGGGGMFRGEAIQGDFLRVPRRRSPDPLADSRHAAREARTVSRWRLHVHRCRRIVVMVTFNGRDQGPRILAPVTTVADVKKFAAIREFGMKPADAAEHVLQFVGQRGASRAGDACRRAGPLPRLRAFRSTSYLKSGSKG